MHNIPVGNIPIIGASKYQQKLAEKQMSSLTPEQQDTIRRQQMAIDMVNSRQRLYEQLFTAALCNPSVLIGTSTEAISEADNVARRAMFMCETHFNEVRADAMEQFGLTHQEKKESNI